MAKRKVVAVAGFGCESSTFSPLPTRLEDFFKTREVDDLQRIYRPATQPPDGAPVDLAGSLPPVSGDYADIDFRLLCRFRAIPGGPIEAAAYQEMRAEMLERLRKLSQDTGGIDGMWLDLHGAMFVTGMEDAEGDLVTGVREVVGRECLLVCSFDLHGNFSGRMADAMDGATAYRTAPHVDIQETRRKAVSLLVRCLREERRPALAYVAVPVAVSGEMSNTADEPAKSLYGETLHQADRVPGVLDASLLVGYCWADEPRSGASVLVTGFERAVCEREALRIAAEVWRRRAEFRFGSPSGSLEEALAHPRPEPGLHIVSDSGDNPTAGGVGDCPAAVSVLSASPAARGWILQGPFDGEAVATCLQAGSGATLRLSLGGKCDKSVPPYNGDVTVVRVYPEASEYEVDINAGSKQPPHIVQTKMPPSVVLRVGEVDVIVCSERKPLHYAADFAALGVDLREYRVLVVKLGYLVPDLECRSAGHFLAMTPGAVYADLVTIEYRRVRRPLYPKDPGMEWSPAVCMARPAL
eukprot:Hpha_TRINITY_DN16680_c3_g1::TRINITY_DN16680_c3_g1_i1::g.182512::m.182512